jgi:hypothetical protein
MINIKAFLVLAFTLIPGLVFAQSNVTLNIILRPLSHLEMIKEVECRKVNKDLLLSLSYEAFIVGGPSSLSLEPLEIDEKKNYYLIKGNQELLLEEDKSTTIQRLPMGSHKNVIRILVKDTKLSNCAKIADKFMLTVTPL